MTPELHCEGPDPILRAVVEQGRQMGKRGWHLVAIEIREGDLEEILGALYPLGDLVRRLGLGIVVGDVAVREVDTVPHGKFMTVWRCRACRGDGCLRCDQRGERRGRP